MTNKLTTGESFLTLSYYEELGEEGLSLHQIAESLGVEFREVKRKFEKRIKDVLIYEEGRFTQSKKSTQVFGVTHMVETYILTAREAKKFVATYQNAVGEAYLDFLLRCEEFTLKHLTKEVERLQSLEVKRQLKSPYKELVDGKVVEVSPVAKVCYKIQHLEKMITGCTVNIGKYKAELVNLVKGE